MVSEAEAPPRGMARSVVALSIAEVLGKVATLLTFTLIARELGVTDFGTFSFGLGLGVLLASLCSLGLDDRLMQLGVRDSHRLLKLLAALLVMRIMLSLLVIGALAAVLLVRGGAFSWELVLLVAAGLVDTLNDAFRAASASRNNQVGPAMVLVVQRFTTLALVGVVLWLHLGLLPVCIAFFSAGCIGALAMALAARRAAGWPHWRTMSFGDIRAHLRATPITGMNELVSMALFRIDTLLLASIAGMVAVGQYNATYRLLETVLFVSWSLARVIVPSFAAATIDLADFADALRSGYAFISALYLPYCAVLLVRGDEIVRLLFGDEFGHAHVALWLAIAPWLFGMAHLTGSAMLARRPDPAVLWASGSALLTNVLLNLALIPRYGAAGAALATSVSYSVQFLVNYTALGRRVPGSTMDRGVVVPAVSAVLMLLVLAVPMSIFLSVPLAIVVYVAIWERLSANFDPRRRAMVLGFVRRPVAA